MILLGILVAGIAAFLILRPRKAWTAVTDGNDYGTKVDPDGSFDFPVGNPQWVVKLPVSQRPGAHYITKPCGSLSAKKGLRLLYRIEIDPGVELHPSSDPAAPTIGPTLYFQRSGDNWSGVGEYDGYRWFATFNSPTPIVAGDFVLEAPFDAKWSGVQDFNSVDNKVAFADALKHAGDFGFVLGGGTGYGHGVFATGKARFTLLGLTTV